MNKRTPKLEEIIQRGIKAWAGERPAAFVARVESYDLETQRANVQPIHRIWFGDDEDGEYRQFSGVLEELPVQFPSFGNWVIHGALAAGDYVLCVVNMRSLEEWLTSGGIDIEAEDRRINHIQDAVVLPGVFHQPLSSNVARADEMVLSHRDGSVQIRLKDGEVIVEGASIKLGANATKLLALADKIDRFIELVDTILSTWVAVSGDGGLALQAAYKAARILEFGPLVTPIGSVATTKVKGE